MNGYAQGGHVAPADPVILDRGCSYVPVAMVRRYGLKFVQRLVGPDTDLVILDEEEDDE